MADVEKWSFCGLKCLSKPGIFIYLRLCVCGYQSYRNCSSKPTLAYIWIFPIIVYRLVFLYTYWWKICIICTWGANNKFHWTILSNVHWNCTILNPASVCVCVSPHPGAEPTVWEDHGLGHRRAAPPASGSRRGGAGDWEGFQQVRRRGRILNPSWPHNRSKLISLETTKCYLVSPAPCLSSFLLSWWRQQPFMECLMS